jgi:hypothetical protein
VNNARWLVVMLMVVPFLAGCDPVVQIRLLSEEDLTATSQAAIVLTDATGPATVVPGTPEIAVTSLPPPTVTPMPSPTPGTLPTPTKLPTKQPTKPPATATAGPESAATRIRFQSGATSAVRSGHLMPDGSHLYVLAARSGQIMDVELSSGATIGLSIWGADRTVLKRSVDGARNWQGILPTSQDYYIQVIAAGQETDYGLRVTAYARIQFAPGGTSATVTGPIERLGSEGVEVGGGYVVRAFAGQTMRVTITSSHGDVLLNIVGADGVPLKRYVDGSAEWEGILPSTQDYLLQPVSVGGATRFTMTVSIGPLGLSRSTGIRLAPGAMPVTAEGHVGS